MPSRTDPKNTKVIGLPELRRNIEKLRKMPRRDRGVQDGFRRAAGQGAGKAAGRARWESVKRGISGISLSASQRPAAAVVSTNPLSHLLENGTVERFHKSGKSVGVMPAQPFFFSGVESAQGVMFATIQEAMERALARVTR